MTNLPKPKTELSIDAFLKSVNKLPPVEAGAGKGRLLLTLDATMSRQPTWDRAMAIQHSMFSEAAKFSGLEVQLAYFRGFDECKSSGWTTNAQTLAKLMSRVDCRGGNTQIGRLLRHVAIEGGQKKVNAVIYVGDAVEENIDSLCQQAGEIGLLGTPLFMFLEGSDMGAEKAFREMARLSGGAFHQFDSSSPGVLGELLAAVAAYASGGRAAMAQLQSTGNRSSHLLLQQL